MHVHEGVEGREEEVELRSSLVDLHNIEGGGMDAWREVVAPSLHEEVQRDTDGGKDPTLKQRMLHRWFVQGNRCAVL